MYKNIIAIYGVPRSGTSWLGEIIDSCPNVRYKFQPLFSYVFKNRIKVESTTSDIVDFFNDLYLEENDFLDQTEKHLNGVYPLFKEKLNSPKNLAYKEARYLYTIPLLLNKINNIKIVAIVRNPYDVLESWINAPKEYRAEWNIYDEWYFGQSKNEFLPENYYGYMKWKEAIKLFCEMKKLYVNNIKIIQYEHLKESAEVVSRELFDFLNLDFSEQTREFIFKSQNSLVENEYSVFRNKELKQTRKYYLPDDIAEEIYYDIKKFKEACTFGYDKMYYKKG